MREVEGLPRSRNQKIWVKEQTTQNGKGKTTEKIIFLIKSLHVKLIKKLSLWLSDKIREFELIMGSGSPEIAGFLPTVLGSAKA